MSETAPETRHENRSRPLVGFRICRAGSPEKLWPFDDSWLCDRLRKKYRLSTSAPPDVVLCAYIIKSRSYCLRTALECRRHFGFRPYLGLVCMENLRLNPSWSDFSITWQPTAGDNFYLPLFTITSLEQYEQWRTGKFSPLLEHHRARPKTKFCLFLYSRYIPVRVYFCRQLARYKPVDCPGNSLNNCRVPGYGPLGSTSNLFGYHTFTLRSQYKFTIAFENESADGYLSEKIRMALTAGSIPIYWGNPRVAEFINPACFINCHDYPNFAAVIEHVKEVDQNPELYERYRRAPLLLPDSKLHASNPENLISFMEDIFEKALARRQQRDADWTENDRQQYSKLTAEYQTPIRPNRFRTMRNKIASNLPRVRKWYRRIRNWSYSRGMPGAKR